MGDAAAVAAAGWGISSGGCCQQAVRSDRQVPRGWGAGGGGWEAGHTALTGAPVGEAAGVLFRRLCSALSPAGAWSHLGGLLVVAVDGTTVSAYDSAANAAAFGKPGTGKERRRRGGGQARAGPEQDEVANPQLRLVTLLACGTRALLDAAFGPVRGRQFGEQALARGLLRSLRPGMLLLADRNFYGYDL